MPWVLKKNAPEFDVVDGPMAGRKFRRGEIYTDVPLGDKGRFETVSESAPKKASPAKTETKKNVDSEVDKLQPVTAPTKNKKIGD